MNKYILLNNKKLSDNKLPESKPKENQQTLEFYIFKHKK